MIPAPAAPHLRVRPRPEPLRPVVLNFHQTPERVAVTATSVGAAAVRRIVLAMRGLGYRFVGVEDCGPAGPPEGAACVTADDGYASTGRVLAPILGELGIPLCVFVLVGAMGGRNRWDLPGVGSRERHLTPEEVCRLAQEGVTIGSHMLGHIDPRRLDDRALADSLQRSRARLQEITGRPVSVISFPRGRLDARVAGQAAIAGYRLGFVSARAPRIPSELAPFAVRRVTVYAPDQVPGLFEWTALRGPGWLSGARSVLAAAGDSLIAATLALRGRSVA